MEIQFQQQQKVKIPLSKMKAKNNNKFIGVRQRPSGRWVAEIKDTTQKIRMWLGTFETAEEAARAYDEAACLLRGSNTRTNFVTHVSQDSPLASRIRNLLNTKKKAKTTKQQSQESCPSTNQDVDACTSSSDNSTVTCTTNSPSDNNTTAEWFSTDEIQDCDSRGFDEVYKPDMRNCLVELDHAVSAQSGTFDHGCRDRFLFAQELVELPKNVGLSESSDMEELSEFERMKVERQISASHGVDEYMETVYDPNEPLWDLPPLCSLLS